jgi:predicted dehydrogenase
MKKVNRRTFLGGLGAASTLTIVPRRVLGGPGFVAPSDMILLAQVGCGTQAQRQVNTGLVKRPDLQFVAVVDPNRDTQDYVDWGRWGNRDRIRLFLEDPEWGANDTGIRGGRDVARQIMETYYQKHDRPGHGMRSYEDYRVMLEKEKAIDAVLIATPDHLHAYVSILAMKAGKHVYCEKPLTRTVAEGRLVARVAKESGVATQMGNFGRSSEGHRQTAEWIWDGAIGQVKEVHAWGAAGSFARGKGRPEGTPEVPPGLDWDLWLGPSEWRPYNPAYAPFNWRGWWAFGGGGLPDMAVHNLDPAFDALKLDVVGLFKALREIKFPADGSLALEYEANPDNPIDEMKACLSVAKEAIAKSAG